LGALVGALLAGVGLLVALVVVQRTLGTTCRWTDPALAAVLVLCWSVLRHRGPTNCPTSGSFPGAVCAACRAD
jgi:hypothetical protein